MVCIYVSGFGVFMCVVRICVWCAYVYVRSEIYLWCEYACGVFVCAEKGVHMVYLCGVCISVCVSICVCACVRAECVCVCVCVCVCSTQINLFIYLFIAQSTAQDHLRAFH